MTLSTRWFMKSKNDDGTEWQSWSLVEAINSLNRTLLHKIQRELLNTMHHFRKVIIQSRYYNEINRRKRPANTIKQVINVRSALSVIESKFRFILNFDSTNFSKVGNNPEKYKKNIRKSLKNPEFFASKNQLHNSVFLTWWIFSVRSVIPLKILLLWL